jgi:hypothetical protein
MARTKGALSRRNQDFETVLDKLQFNVPHEAVKLYPSLGPALKLRLLSLLAEYVVAKPSDKLTKAQQRERQAEAIMAEESSEDLLERAMQ